MYAEFKNEDLGLSGEGWTRARVIASVGGDYEDDTRKWSWSGVFNVKKIDAIPFKKIDYLTIEGRALGLGIIEMLLDPQQRWNEIQNQKATSMKVASRHIYQTRDAQIERNIMTDVLDGDIIKVMNEITPIDTTERNLGAYTQEERVLMDVVRSNANAFESLTGENLPSGTPYRLGAMMAQQGGKLFEFIRENIGLFLEEVVKEWIIPEFDKNVTNEHIFQLFDAETIEYIIEKDVNRRLNEAIKKYVMDTGFFPPKADLELLKQAEIDNNKGTLFLDIVKGYLKFDKDVEIDITGEANNLAGQVETISNLLQLLAQNPQMVTMPETKKLFGKLLDTIGFSPALIQ
ncbi:MAG: hypothetical protein EOM67_13645, partial [Spirochaetia bacterium]|nr:hypothetical protein [Spirochaetia bacterium]